MSSNKGANGSDGFKYDREDILRRAAGRWNEIIYDLVHDLRPAIDAGPKKHVGCPFHPGKSVDNLRVMPTFAETGRMICNTCGNKANGLAVLTWAGRSFYEALRDVSEWLDGRVASMTPEMIAKIERELEVKRKRKAREQARKDKFFQRELNRVWRESVPLDHPKAEPGRLYLANRGLARPTASKDVRVHPCLEMFDKDNKVIAKLPAIILRFRTADGNPGTLHRIYTTQDGQKLPDGDDITRKKMMPHPDAVTLMGGAIRLTEVQETLGVGEGYETAEAVMELFPRIPCWPLYSATLLEGFVPPEGVKRVIIFADKDVLKPRRGREPARRGEEAAMVLLKRLWEMGVQAEIRYPPMPLPDDASRGVDWLDFLNFRKAQQKAKEQAKAKAKAQSSASKKLVAA